MTPTFTCIACGREVSSGSGKCPVCKPIRTYAKQCHRVCESNKCGHHGTRDGCNGCLLLLRPSRIWNRLLAGGGCVAAKPLFNSFEHSSELHLHPIDLSTFVATRFNRLNEVSLVAFHFNPSKFKRLRETYYEWLPSLGPLASRLRCYELVYDDDIPEIEGSIVVRGTRSKNVMWQKEAIMNLALRETPPAVKYFGWLDHDLVLSNNNWLSDAVAKIDSGSVAVQLFSLVNRLSLAKHSSATRAGSIAGKGMGAPGGAWIADRDYLDTVGGFELSNIFGGGDQSFDDAMRGKVGSHVTLYPKAMADEVARWAVEASRIRGIRPASYVESVAYHLWHGEHVNRQYGTRHRLLHSESFDPLTDMRVAANGLLEWCSDKPGLHAGVAKFFDDRREDG